MLEKINDYFIKLLFSYLNEKRKLILIKTCKKLQDITNISFTNYKILSGKYIILEKDGTAKVFGFRFDGLIYEEGFLNGKKNGKGAHYNYHCTTEDEYKYVGEYLNGKRNGKGKEYYYEEGLLFEGEYFNGERNGKGKEYNKKGELIFEGEYINYYRNGKGKEYKKGKLLYWNFQECDNINIQKLNGTGKELDPYCNLIYQGEYLNGKRNRMLKKWKRKRI